MAEQVAPPLKIDITNESPVPPIAAAFLVNFDHRKGYTLGWYKSLEGVQVEGVVEFKSLPSGLHNVEEDLVYFIHDEYAGLSAFINRPDPQSDRAARMLAVGILVPLEHGRMGRSWRHAENLKELAKTQVEDPTDTSALEDYWQKHMLKPDQQTPQTPETPGRDESAERPNGYNKSRTMSTTTTFIASHHSLTPHHPALTLVDSIKLFGPLIFPLYRAALLRKRILIITDAPVEFACNLVYNLSILSSISKSLLPILPEADNSNVRLRPLFTIGVMDIVQLQEEKDAGPNRSFIACTTDDVLASKPDLYDILVLMPKSDSRASESRAFPHVIASTPELSKTFPSIGIRATLRDSHRFSHLSQGLRQYGPSEAAATDDAASSIRSHSSSYSAYKNLIEPPSWSRVAYTSLVWWASAGDRRGGFTEIEDNESERDHALLHGEGEEDQTREVATVAYFHRMTATIAQTISNAVARADGEHESDEPYRDDDDDEDEDDTTPAVNGSEDSQALLNTSEELPDVEINADDMIAMGLDSWSASDNKFVEEMVELWWQRKAILRPISIECCGLRIL